MPEPRDDNECGLEHLPDGGCGAVRQLGYLVLPEREERDNPADVDRR